MTPWLKWILRAVAGVALLVAGLAGLGSMQPVSHTATVSVVVRGEPERVWAVITDVEGLPDWRPNVTETERLPDLAGLPVWRESGATGSMTLEVTVWEPPRRMVTRIADEGLPFGGTWTYALLPDPLGTRVTLTENGEIYNPIFRFVSRFVLGLDATMRTYLDGLETHMGAVGG